jgi:phage-related protein
VKAYEAANAADPRVSEYKVGDRVHAKFGSGIVSNVDGKKLTVAFHTGEKRILDDFVERE